MEHIPVKMILKKENKKKLHDFITSYPVPDGYRIRTFKKGDETLWAQIETRAGEFKNEGAALTRFNEEFGAFGEQLEKYCFFMEDMGAKLAVGTAMGWFGRTESTLGTGRLHWVGIRNDYQGKKLAKPLIAKAGEILYHNYDQSYLTTQTTSYKAINIYLEMGFQPTIDGERDVRAWNIIERVLEKKVI